ncbi:MAG: FHA domain-containing protein [Candidatus Contendobacter sp.]|nr:FHA domain-containing protein [Candidatus Contendobacter sp.]
MNPRFGCKIARIEIRPLNEAAKETLQELFAYIESDAIAGTIRREILPKVPGHCFDLSEVGISPKYEGGGQSPAKDTLLEELIGPAATKDDDCMIAFGWDRADLPAPSGDVAGIGGWRLHDAKGENPIPLKSPPFPSQRLVLGSDPSADIAVEGSYTSGAHGWLWLDHEARWWYRDAGSTNGSRVRRPGQRDWISPGRTGGSPAEPVELTPGAELVFAAEPNNDSRADYPKLIVPGSGGRRGTPINVGAGAATPRTPIAGGARPASASPVAAIRVEDVNGTRIFPVGADGLPFKVGRSSENPLPIPGAHASVSSDHLEIRAFEAGGLRVRVLGRNDASLAGKPMKKGDEAIWGWGEALVLVESPMEGEPVCRLILQRAADAERAP